MRLKARPTLSHNLIHRYSATLMTEEAHHREDREATQHAGQEIDNWDGYSVTINVDVEIIVRRKTPASIDSYKINIVKFEINITIDFKTGKNYHVFCR